MKSADFDYTLPDKLIAQKPLAERSSSRLLVADPMNATVSDRRFTDIIELLDSGDLLIFNNTRVFPARLYGQKETGGKIEMLVERMVNDHRLLAHIKSSKSPPAGCQLILENSIDCRVAGRQGELFIVEQDSETGWLELLRQYGHMPLPPYIERPDDGDDRERYQTVYSEKTGAVAAPTAGLHFDHNVLEQLKIKGVETAFVTLHVGAGTFQPVRVENVKDHVMHAEWVEVSEEVCQQVNRTVLKGKRVVAVGTTVVRSLESAAVGGQLRAFSGDTRLFITPGFRFNVTDAMLTNFHLPKSTLLMLVSAFAGKDFMLKAYHHAVQQHYRFFSYGDAMFISHRIE